MKKSHEFKGNIGLERIYVKKMMERHNSNLENVKASRDVSRWKDPEKVRLLKMEDGKKKMKNQAIAKSNDLLVERVFNLLTEKRKVKSHAYAPGYRRLVSGGVVIDCYANAGNNNFTKMHSKTANRWREEKLINEQNKRLHDHIKAVQSPFRKEVFDEQYRKHRAITKILNNKVPPSLLHLGLTGKLNKTEQQLFSPYEANISRMRAKKEKDRLADELQSPLQVAKGFYSFAYEADLELDKNRFIPDYHPIVCIDKSAFPSISVANQTTGEKIGYKYKNATSVEERELARKQALVYFHETGIDPIAAYTNSNSKMKAKDVNIYDDIFENHNAAYNYLMSTCHPCGDEKLWFLNQIEDDVEDDAAYAMRQEAFLKGRGGKSSKLNQTNTIASRIPDSYVNGGVTSPLRVASNSVKSRPQSAPAPTASSTVVNRHAINAGNVLKPKKSVIPPGQEVNYLHRATTKGMTRIDKSKDNYKDDQDSEPPFYSQKDAEQDEAEMLKNLMALRKEDESYQEELRKKKLKENSNELILDSTFIRKTPPPSVPKPIFSNTNKHFEERVENVKNKAPLARPKSANALHNSATNAASGRKRLNEALKAASSSNAILMNKQHEKAIKLRTNSMKKDERQTEGDNQNTAASIKNFNAADAVNKEPVSISIQSRKLSNVSSPVSQQGLHVKTKHDMELEPKEVDLPDILKSIPHNIILRQNTIFKCKMMSKLEFSNKTGIGKQNSSYPFEVRIYDVGAILSGHEYHHIYCLQQTYEELSKCNPNEKKNRNNSENIKNIITSRGVVVEAIFHVKNKTNLGDLKNQDVFSNTDRLNDAHGEKMTPAPAVETEHVVRSTLYLPVRQLRNLAIVSNCDMLYGQLTKSIRSLCHVPNPSMDKKMKSSAQAENAIKLTEDANYQYQAQSHPKMKVAPKSYKEHHMLHGTKQHANSNPLHHGGGGGGGMYNLLQTTAKANTNKNDFIDKNEECIYKGVLYSPITNYLEYEEQEVLCDMILKHITIYYDPNTRISKISLILPT